MKKQLALVIFCCFAVIAAASDLSKSAQAQAKELARDGWMAFPGRLPIAEQLEACYVLDDESSKEHPKYICASGESEICSSLEEAELQAISIAKIQLVENYDTKIQAFYGDGSIENRNEVSKPVEYGYRREATYITECSIENKCRGNVHVGRTFFARYYGSELLMSNIQDGQNVQSEIHWDAVMRYCDVSAIATTAWCPLKLYRSTDKGYQVKVTLCNYAMTKGE